MAKRVHDVVYVDSEAHAVPDLSHHLSDLAKARRHSPLKLLARYITDPNLLSLAGGMPHPDYFPYETISAQVLTHDAYSLDPPSASSSGSPFGWLWRLLGAERKHEEISIPKYAPGGQDAIQLSTALQYGTAIGMQPLVKFVREFSLKVYKPYLPNTDILLHTGNTDGWSKVVLTFLNKGDSLLVEDWTYPSALMASLPVGVRCVPVDMDEQGMRPDLLEELLANWDEQDHDGMKRPHVMYIVPIGQNPCGTTMKSERKKALYEICVKYDIIIVEDDPYFFLQEGEYIPESFRQTSHTSTTIPSDDSEGWINSLEPSFLKFDYEGRVIRMDTFSKTIAPGSRLGFFTCSPLFADHLLRIGEISTQAPCGYSQVLVTQLVAKQWGYDKYIRWLRGLQTQYTQRRDLLLDAIAAEFDISEEQADPSFLNGAKVLVARERQTGPWRNEKFYGTDKNTWFSFVPPTSGMFVWVKIHLYNHPAFGSPTSEVDGTLEYQFWLSLVKAGVLFAPGWIFSPDEDVAYPPDPVVQRLLTQGRPKSSSIDDDHSPAYCHLRISFSSATDQDMKAAMRVFAAVLKKHFTAKLHKRVRTRSAAIASTSSLPLRFPTSSAAAKTLSINSASPASQKKLEQTTNGRQPKTIKTSTSSRPKKAYILGDVDYVNLMSGRRKAKEEGLKAK